MRSELEWPFQYTPHQYFEGTLAEVVFVMLALGNTIGGSLGPAGPRLEPRAHEPLVMR